MLVAKYIMMRKLMLSKLETLSVLSCTEYGNLKQIFPKLNYSSIRFFLNKGRRKGRTSYELFIERVPIPFFNKKS
jgi:hypothetical protein